MQAAKATLHPQSPAIFTTEISRFKHEMSCMATNMLEHPGAPEMPVATPPSRPQPVVMPTGEQIRAARAMLGWSVATLASRAGVSWRTIQRAEAAGDQVPRMHIATVEKIQGALEAEGIEFLRAGQRSNGGPGIRRRL
jgi:ribosome-binding protein aMBF1 (putative translation factor)